MSENNESNSSFLFGIIIGAIIGAVIAIVIYKNNRTEIFDNLRSKFDDLLKKYTNQTVPMFSKPKKKKIVKSTKKIKVTLPKTLETVSLAPVKIQKPKKMFVK
ncbi:hypothetical protein KBC75_03005 [Candidatus Shapirobacteria bacterium]|nr:hypothetical protein [Candidatus Shapirobacteria bacterium]